MLRVLMIIVVTVFTITTQGQTLKELGGTGQISNDFMARNAFLLPNDTVTTKAKNSDVDSCQQLAKVNGIIYTYDCSAGHWVQLATGVFGPTLYTGDGTLTGSRQVHLNGYQLQFVDDGSSYGETRFNMGGGFIQNTIKAPFGDPNTNFAGLMSVNPYGSYVGTEARTRITRLYSDSLSAETVYSNFSDGNPSAGYENRAGVDSLGFFYKHGFMGHPSTVNTTLLRIDSTGRITASKYKNNVAGDSVLSTDNNGLLKLKYVSTGTWDSTKVKDSVIRNQNWQTQTANYNITGKGTASWLTATNATGVPYVPYLTFAHDGLDTTKKAWGFGISGTPGGSPFNVGDSLTLRSYSTTGTFLRDIMVFFRNGGVRIVGGNSFTVGNPGQITFGALTVYGNAVFNSPALTLNGGLQVQDGIQERKTTTVTTDYTVLTTDLYINVNNTANCIIQIPTAQTGPVTGWKFYIKKISNNAATVTVQVGGLGAGIQLIDGVLTSVISGFNNSIYVHDDGSNYFIY